MEIKIETSDSKLAADLLESTLSTVKPGCQRTIPGGATITFQNSIRRRALNVPPETITLILSLGTSVAANVVSAWLYEKLRGRDVNLYIDRREIQIENGEIKKIIEESIQKYE